MATYNELLALASVPDLINRTRVACIIAAEVIGNEIDTTPNHVNRMKWAKAVFNNPPAESLPMLQAILAKNKGLTAAAITAVTDAALQLAVDSEINTLAGIS